jgi:hypothetical protein
MTNPAGAQPNTYDETIARLKLEIEAHAASLKSSPAWSEIEKAYRALMAIEELAGARKTSLEDLLGVFPVKTAQGAATSEKSLKLALEGQQEPGAAAEIEKGS